MIEGSSTQNLLIMTIVAFIIVIVTFSVTIGRFLFPSLAFILFHGIEASSRTLVLSINSVRGTALSSQGISTMDYPEDAFMVQIYSNASCYHFFLEKFEGLDPNIKECDGGLCICTGRYDNFLCIGQYTLNPNPCQGCGVWPLCLTCPEDRHSCSPDLSDVRACLPWETCNANWDEGVPTWISSTFLPESRLKNEKNKMFWYKDFSQNAKEFLEDFCYHFFMGMDGATTNITSMDCRRIDDDAPLVVHDDECDVDDCGQNIFLWLHSVDGSKINYAEIRGFSNFVTMTDYDIK